MPISATPTRDAHKTTRRDFLKNAGLTAGLLILPTGFLRGENAPSNRINVAMVGPGGQGRTDMRGVLNAGGKVVAICDVVTDLPAGVKKRFAGDYPHVADAQTFTDYRVMLDKLGKDIDAVIVSTPDHTHFTVALDSIQRGKHVYVQKPMCHSIDQVRRLSKAAADAKVVSSMGNQGHSSNHIRMVKEWFEAGLFGEIKKIDCWDGQFMRGSQHYAAPKPQPKNLAWDLWLGPAKYRPFFPGVAPGWRPYYEFGSGSLGDMAAHIIDPAYYILDLDYPEKIEILERKDYTEVAYASHTKMIFHFPAKGNRGPVQLVWWHGKDFRPKAPTDLEYKEFNERKNDENLPEDPRLNLHGGVTGYLGRKHNDGLTLNGSLFYGEKVTFNMGQYGDFFFTAPKTKFAELKAKEPPKKYSRFKGGHYKDWVKSIRTGGKAVSDFAYAGPLTEVICMGNIAQRLGRDLRWDAKNGKFINDDQANALIFDQPPRQGFHA
ncbi:MAG: Gfo/Idh/MocA family oxidoreductase [Puniceicoccales bacterium]|jgi:predicted dehydrogenase|nr:Gfo/Idh/MocA family oxidoreductase [Puniceicoccales bacterium]